MSADTVCTCGSRLAACVRSLSLALLAVWALTGCQSLPPWAVVAQKPRTQEQTAQEPTPHELNAVVRYAAQVQGLSPRRLEREYERLAGGAGPAYAIRMALLLSHPEAPFRDTDRALRLLEDYLEGSAAGASCCHEFAAFLRDSLLEQRHSRVQMSNTLLALRQERKALEQEVQHLRSAVAEERAKRSKLESQIEALKAIEKSLDKVQRVEQRLQE